MHFIRQSDVRSLFIHLFAYNLSQLQCLFLSFGIILSINSGYYSRLLKSIHKRDDRAIVKARD